MKYIPLIQVCDFQGGSQPPKDQWIDHEKEGYIRMLQIRDFTQPDKDNVEFVRISKTIKTCNEDDILIGRYGASVGKILTGLAGAYNVAIIKTIPDTSKLSKRFLYHYLNSPYFQNFILSVGSRAAQAGFNKDDLSDAQITDLSLEEQSNVVSQLDNVTELIAMRKEQLAKLDELVKARFVEMFGDPQDNPYGYRMVRLSDIAEYYNGLTYKPENVVEEGTIVLRSSNIQNSQLDFTDTVRVDCAIKERLMVQDNDILMCSRNGSAKLVGKVALIKGIQEPMSFGAFMMIIRSQYYGYLMTYFQMDAFRQQIRTGATTTINQITGRMLDDITIPLPPKALVEQFMVFVDQTDKSKLTIQRSLDKLELLKKALMQKYFG